MQNKGTFYSKGILVELVMYALWIKIFIYFVVHNNGYIIVHDILQKHFELLYWTKMPLTGYVFEGYTVTTWPTAWQPSPNEKLTLKNKYTLTNLHWWKNKNTAPYIYVFLYFLLHVQPDLVLDIVAL